MFKYIIFPFLTIVISKEILFINEEILFILSFLIFVWAFVNFLGKSVAFFFSHNAREAAGVYVDLFSSRFSFMGQRRKELEKFLSFSSELLFLSSIVLTRAEAVESECRNAVEANVRYHFDSLLRTLFFLDLHIKERLVRNYVRGAFSFFRRVPVYKLSSFRLRGREGRKFVPFLSFRFRLFLRLKKV